MELPSTLCSNVYDFAFCPEPCYDRLVDLADPEDWGPNNRILKNYLSFSFSRAVFLTERDVDQTAPSNPPLVFDDDRCLFNTGLYTRRYETIYGLFEPNTKPDASQRWFLKGFFKESDPMLVSFEHLPCRVRFAEDPSELVFDYRLPIRSNIDHILGDEENLTRIPASLLGRVTRCCCVVPLRAPSSKPPAAPPPITRSPCHSFTEAGSSCCCRCA